MLKTEFADFSEAINAFNIKQDECLLIHSALYRFGRLKFSTDDILNHFLKIIPNGQLVLPTFTYSYRRGEVFDPLTSRPDKKLGMLVNHSFDKFTYRNDCPLFSFGAIGRDADRFIKRQSKNCFGEGSVFDQLCDLSAKILCLGVDFNSGISMFMNCEKLADVPYRRDLIISGQSLKNGQLVNDTAVHFARDEIGYPELSIDRRAIGEKLIDKKICEVFELSHVPLYMIDANDFRDYVCGELIKNRLCMVSK